MQIHYLGNSLESWISAIALIVVVTVAFSVFKRVLIRRIATHTALAEHIRQGLLGELVRRTSTFVVLIVICYLASLLLRLPSGVTGTLKVLTIIVGLLQVIVWGNLVITFGTRRVTARLQDDAPDASTMQVISYIVRGTLISVLVLVAMNNMGINVTTLIAGLGIGGIAIGFALQRILGDIFSSVVILLDKPFGVGDFIMVDNFIGTVERIGVKTTRMKSLSGEEIVIPNNDLVNGRLHNYRNMVERRVVMEVQVVYGTTLEQLKKIPALLQEIVERQPLTRFDRAHFKDYGAFYLEFELVYFMLVADYRKYMDTQEEINLEIYRVFGEEGIEFAFPTQTLIIERPPRQ